MSQRVTRVERVQQVAALRAEGLLYREITARLGISTSSAHAYAADPAGEKDRARKAKVFGLCPDCGAKLVNGGSAIPPGTRCTACKNERVKADSRRWILDSIAEWAERFGAPPGAMDWNPAHARAAGLHWKVERYESTERPWPSVTLVQNRFGSWSAGIAAAGWEPRRSGEYGRDGEQPAIVTETIALYRSGLTLAEVGDRLGVSWSAIQHRLRKAGEPIRPRRSTAAWHARTARHPLRCVGCADLIPARTEHWHHIDHGHYCSDCDRPD